MKKAKLFTQTIKKTSILLLFIVAISACSSSDDDFTQTEEVAEKVMQDYAENIQKLAVPGALENSDNMYAAQANQNFNAIKSMAFGFGALFILPESAYSSKSRVKTSAKSSATNASKTYTWSANGQSVTYTITEKSDRYLFEYKVSSNDFTGKLMDGYQLKNGKYSEFKIYGENGAETFNIKYMVDNEITTIDLVSDYQRFVLKSNTNTNAGSLDLYDSNVLAIKYVWTANGTGTYTNYETNETFSW